jgi:hypothetical protein
VKFPVLVYPGYTFMGAKPNAVPAVTGQVNNVIGCDLWMGLLLKSLYKIAVIDIQTVGGPDPQVAILINGYGTDIIFRKTIGGIDMVE